jgi:thiol-disulfide isomerase/thioredoxin
MRPLYLLLALAACGGSDPVEPPPVTDPGPSNADGDHDYLTDAEEAELGTDPANPDSDADGYLDGDEVLESTDPLDGASLIYQGGWPYQRFKDDIADPGFDTTAEAGAVVPRFVAIDQHGQEVDLYDYAMHGRPVVIDLSAGWCGACREMAAWLEGEPTTSLDIPPELDVIPEKVAAGEIDWITIYFQDSSSTPADADDVAEWYASYPNPRVAVLADTDQAMLDWLWPGGYPSIQVLDEDMTLRTYDRFDYLPALQSLVD